MSENQQEWDISSIGEYCITSSGGTPNRSDPLAYGGDIPWVKSGEVASTDIWATEEHITPHGLNSSSAKIAEEGSILVAMYGATAGQVARLKISAATNQAILAIRPKSGALDSDFLYHFIHRSKNALLATCQGSGQPNLSAGIIRDLEIAIPPLPEQKKIAEILSGIDRAIEARKRTADKITTTCRFVADEILQQAKYTYGSIKIKDCANRLWQGINTAADRVEYHERGVPILQAKHITSGQIDSGGARFLCEGDYSRYSCRFQPSVGDILFTNIGTIGKSAIVTTPSKFLVAWNIFLISPSDAIESEYLHCFMQVLDQQNYFHQHAAGNATKFINKTLISELEVPLPPREEQIKICARIKALSRAAKCSQDAASKHLELKTSLSADLLSGRKRVSI